MSISSKINKVGYEKIEVRASFDCAEGIYIWRVYFKPNWLGLIKEHREKIAFIPALDEEEFVSANKIADKMISHYAKVTGNFMRKVTRNA